MQKFKVTVHYTIAETITINNEQGIGLNDQKIAFTIDAPSHAIAEALVLGTILDTISNTAPNKCYTRVNNTYVEPLTDL